MKKQKPNVVMFSSLDSGGWFPAENLSKSLKESEGRRMLRIEGEAGTRAGGWGQLLWEEAGRGRHWVGFLHQSSTERDGRGRREWGQGLHQGL